MKKTFFLLTILWFLYSCSSTNEISGKKFIYKSNNRELELSFDDGNLCTLKNTFYCNDIEDKYKEITIQATYKRKSNRIIIKNTLCQLNTCEFSPTIDIPIQNTNDCLFLNEQNRNEKRIFDGRTYQSDYYKYGLVPNIDIDTLYINKNQITFIKKLGRSNFGFVFK